MKLESSPCCQLCTQGCLGTFTHMFWECPGVQLFWLQVTKSLSKILNKEVPCCPVLCLLNDNSQFPMSTHEKRVWISGLTAAKKMLETTTRSIIRSLVEPPDRHSTTRAFCCTVSWGKGQNTKILVRSYHSC